MDNDSVGRVNNHIYFLRAEFDGRRSGLALPEDYRAFITRIGNGGAGPFYGVFRLGEHDDGHGFSKWEGGALVGNLSEPFPFVDAWNLPQTFWDQKPDPSEGMTVDEEDRLFEEWDAKLDKEYWNPELVNGAIPICHQGYALRIWLVVHGSCRGQIWRDARVDEEGIYPLTEGGQPVTFDRWYSSWLEESLKAASRSPP